MTHYEKGLSNLSYTNKDFSTIYPELLDLAKSLSYKWDPTTSDESDPGNVLIKLGALLGDKLNYNVDKNVLELMPLSVTQESNARQIFDQCGYCMKYYQAGTTTLSLKMTKIPELTQETINVITAANADTNNSIDGETIVCVIPQFTLVSDPKNEYIYTTVEDAHVLSDGITVTAAALQGVITNYQINSEEVITAANLDYNRRLYFTEKDIAENGIFITNVYSTAPDKTNYEEWVPVDNLSIQSYGKTCYKFGLEENGSRCFIEFPSDIDTLIGEGIKIKYIRTSGYSGNITKKCIQKFYTDMNDVKVYTISRGSAYSSTTSITDENITVVNLDPVTDGKDPETIDEAYANYQKVKNTFNTLVSTTDYSNFLFTNKNISNGFVSDRTTDPSESYNILESSNNFKRITHAQYTRAPSSAEDGAEKMTAFDLRLYGFYYTTNLTNPTQFNRTFTLIPYSSLNLAARQIEDDLEDIKSLQHDFKNYIDKLPLLIKNKFPIDCRVIPQYNLSNAEHDDVVRNISKALYNALNSRQLQFGAEVEYEYVYNTIQNADPRIKAVALDPLVYQTYVVYKEGDDFKEVRVDVSADESNSNGELINDFRTIITAKSVLDGKTPLYVPDDTFTYSINHKDGVIARNVYTATTSTEIPLEKPLRANENIILTAPSLLDRLEYTNVKYIYHFAEKVPSDAVYQLGSTDYIYMFWKTGDSEDDPYNVQFYGENTILSPTFTMSAQSEDNLEVLARESLMSTLDGKLATNASCLHNKLQGVISSSTKSGTIKDSTAIQVDMTPKTGKTEPTTLTLFEFISGLQGKGCVLSGTDQIIIKEINQVTVTDSTQQIYWFTQNTSSDGSEYVLFESGDSTYTLRANEYLIYSNKNKTQLVMVGEGTTITRSNNQGRWSTPAISYDNFIEDPLGSIDEGGSDGKSVWFTISEGTHLTVTENEYHQLGPGCSLFIEDFNKNITSTPATSFNQTISYQTDDTAASKVEVPMRCSSSLAWNIYSVLNVLSSNNIIDVYPGQTYEFFDADDKETPVLISNVELNMNTWGSPEQHLQLSTELSRFGGENVDVTSYDLIECKQVPLTVYKYSDKKDTEYAIDYKDSSTEKAINKDNFVLSQQTEVSLQFINDNLTVSVNLDVPQGKYVIPITVALAPNATMNIYWNDNSDTEEFSNSASEEFLLKTEFKSLAVVAGSNNTLSVTFNGTDTTEFSTITFGKLLRYSKKPDDKLLTFIDSIDPNKLFDRTYRVPSTDLIAEPLHPTSFFNQNHPYNKYTICQWSVDDDSQLKNNLQLITKVK